MSGSVRCRKPGCGANVTTGHPCTDYDCPERFVLASDYQAMEKARDATIAALQSENARLREALAIYEPIFNENGNPVIAKSAIRIRVKAARAAFSAPDVTRREE